MKTSMIALCVLTAAGCVSGPVSADRPDGATPSLDAGDGSTPDGGLQAADVLIDRVLDAPTSSDRPFADRGASNQGVDDGTVREDVPPGDHPLAPDVPVMPDAADVPSVDSPDAGGVTSDIPPLSDSAYDAGGDRPPGVDAVRDDVPEGWIYCSVADAGPRLVNPNNDAVNCGGCGRRCCGLFCLSGRCTSDGPPGSLACPLTPEEEEARGCFGDVTFNGLTDANNCGGCRVRCATGEVCLSGMCRSP